MFTVAKSWVRGLLIRSRSIHSSMEACVSWERVCVGLWVGVTVELSNWESPHLCVSASEEASYHHPHCCALYDSLHFQ